MNNIKKIGLLSHTSNIGGAEKMLIALGEKLSKNGYDVCVIAPGKGLVFEECCEKGIAYVTIDSLPFYIFQSKKIDEEFANRTLLGIKELANIITSLDIDLLINNTLTNLVGVLAANECRVPVVTWVHGILDPFLLGNAYDSNTRLMFDKFVFALSNKIVFCSKWTENFYKNIILDDNYCAIDNWVDMACDEKKKGEKRIICLNSIEKNKGIIEALEAVSLLQKRGIDVSLDIYGKNGTEFECDVVKTIKTHKLEKKVFLHEKKDDVKSIYENADILIQPSYLESFGLTIIEAMAAKVLVVSAKSGGPEDIIKDGKNGFLVEKGSSSDLADAIERAIFSEKRDEIVDNAYQDYLKLYNGKVAEEKWLNLIDNCQNGDYKIKSLYVDALDLLLRNMGTIVDDVVITSSPRAIDVEDIMISKVIKGICDFRIKSFEGKLLELSVIFTELSGRTKKGQMKASIKKNGKMISTSAISLDKVVNNTWKKIVFDEILVEKNDKLYLTLEYEGEEEYVVYMWKRKNILQKIAIKTHLFEDELYCVV